MHILQKCTPNFTSIQNRKEEDMLKRRNIDVPPGDESSSLTLSLNSFTSESLQQLVLVSVHCGIGSSERRISSSIHATMSFTHPGSTLNVCPY